MSSDHDRRLREKPTRDNRIIQLSPAAYIMEVGKATAGAVGLMPQYWEKEDKSKVFLIQQLPHILDKVTTVLSENLSIDRFPIVDIGDGHGVLSLLGDPPVPF